MAILCALVACAMPSPAHAATPAAVESAVPPANRVVVVSPVVLDRTLRAGRSSDLAIDVTNQTGVGQQFAVDVVDVAPGRSATEDKQLLTPGRHAARGAARWLTISPGDRAFSLPAGATRTLHVTALAPPHATPGGHYASVLVQVQPGGSGNLRIKAQVGVLVLLTAPGVVRHHLDVEVELAPRLALLHRPSATLRLHNSGNVHEQVQGRVRTGGWFAPEQSAAVRPLVVLPGTTREVPIVLSDRFAPDVLHARFDPAGKTRAHVAHASAIVAPWWLLLVLVIAAGVTAWRLRSRRRERGNDEDPYDDHRGEPTGIDDLS